MSAPPAYSPSAASAPASAPAALSMYALRVAYRGCAPGNAMVSLHSADPSSSSEEHGACLEARVDSANNEVALIVTARDADIARYCAKIADELHGSIISCARITTDEQRQAALRPALTAVEQQLARIVFGGSPLSEFTAFLGIIIAFFVAAGALAHGAR